VISSIDLDVIVPGDVVTVADAAGNRAKGDVLRNVKDGLLSVLAFGTSIPFARPSRTGHHTLLPGVRLLDHQPQLFGGAA
jgi:hypothetical protein